MCHETHFILILLGAINVNIVIHVFVQRVNQPELQFLWTEVITYQ
jgi:hypothetical protein